MKIFQRLLGTVLFRPATYREVGENANVWSESLPLVVVLAIANSVLYTWIHGLTLQTATRLLAPPISWALLGYLSSLFIKGIYKLDVPYTKLLKVFAYAQIPGSLGLFIVTWIAGIAGKAGAWSYFFELALLVSIVEEVLSIREASQTTTGRATIVFVISFILEGVLIAIINRVIGGI